MSTVAEVFAPAFLNGAAATRQDFARMAGVLEADSLRFLPVESIARAIGRSEHDLCQACISGRYPTPWGQRLYDIALDNNGRDAAPTRTYEQAEVAEMAHQR